MQMCHVSLKICSSSEGLASHTGVFRGAHFALRAPLKMPAWEATEGSSEGQIKLPKPVLTYVLAQCFTNL